jgi:hypothetical protein
MLRAAFYEFIKIEDFVKSKFFPSLAGGDEGGDGNL